MSRTFLLLLVMFLTTLTWSQEYTRTLQTPATVKGFIGGESHDHYTVHASEGQIMKIEFSWKLEHDKELGDNRADFDVWDWPGFAAAPNLKPGKNSRSTVWIGRVPRTDNFHIDVTAHPSAHYTLKVTVQ